MGLQSVFQSAAETIVDAFGDVASTIAYHSLGTFAYNATTGGNTESGSSDITIKMISDEIKSEEIQDRDIKMTDRKLLVANNDISVTPKVGDYCTIDSQRFNVVWKETDPAIALYQLYVRRT
jgi:hypothetical protein